jgi:hypothetical protein
VKRRKQKPIPNAEAVSEFCERESLMRGAAMLERGRKIGRLEGIVAALEMGEGTIRLAGSARAFLAPILRAEIARLKGETT